jgi:hypothetical protein
METTPRKARRITYSTEIRNLKKRLSLSDAQKAFAIGTILGDANLELNWSKTNYKIRFAHSEKQKDYVSWKYQNLKDWILTKPRYYSKTKSYFFNTISHTDITSLAEIFIKNNKKVIPENISELLENPLTLAVWFMDDGNAIHRNAELHGFHINSQSYTLKENILLRDSLRFIYNLSVEVEKNNHNKHGEDYYRLRINKSSIDTFQNMLVDHIIPAMQYKLI